MEGIGNVGVDEGVQEGNSAAQESGCTPGGNARSALQEVRVNCERPEKSGKEQQGRKAKATQGQSHYGPSGNGSYSGIQDKTGQPPQAEGPNGAKADQHLPQLEAQGRPGAIEQALVDAFGRERVTVRNPRCIVVKAARVKYCIHIKKGGALKMQTAGSACRSYASLNDLIDAIDIHADPPTKERTVNVSALLALLDSQGHRCALSGRELTPQNLTLDHINPFAQSDDHTLDNVHLVTGEVNLARGSLSTGDFIRLCRDVARTHPEGSSNV